MAILPATTKAVNDRESQVELESSSHDEAMERIQNFLRRLRFGAINVVIQDGVVVQIDRTEKNRLRKANPPPNEHR